MMKQRSSLWLRHALSCGPFAVLLLLVSCNGCTTHEPPTDTTDPSTDSLAVAPAHVEAVEVSGTIGDGSSMNVLELVTDQLDTLSIEVPGTMGVAGGMRAGDAVSVIYSRQDDALVSLVAVNVSALQHLWTQPSSQGGTQSLELDHGGSATTYGMPAGVDYDRWSLHDGRLLLHSPTLPGVESSGYTDTFDILMLTADTLVLSNDDIPIIFWREN